METQNLDLKRGGGGEVKSPYNRGAGENLQGERYPGL